LRDCTVISGIAFPALFFRQRTAEDYARAAVAVAYLLLAFIAIYPVAHQ
jgi:hypothetical protein